MQARIYTSKFKIKITYSVILNIDILGYVIFWKNCCSFQIGN